MYLYAIRNNSEASQFFCTGISEFSWSLRKVNVVCSVKRYHTKNSVEDNDSVASYHNNSPKDTVAGVKVMKIRAWQFTKHFHKGAAHKLWGGRQNWFCSQITQPKLPRHNSWFLHSRLLTASPVFIPSFLPDPFVCAGPQFLSSPLPVGELEKLLCGPISKR